MQAVESGGRLGDEGKQVVYPDQIAVTREVFLPSQIEIDYALRVKMAVAEAQKKGLGAITVDGKLIDAANLRMIDRLLRLI